MRRIPILPPGGLLMVLAGAAIAIWVRLDIGLVAIGDGVLMWAAWFWLFAPAWAAREEERES